MPLSGPWQICPPSSASCRPRAASTYGLWQPSGGMRRSRGGHICQCPSSSHGILSHILSIWVISITAILTSRRCSIIALHSCRRLRNQRRNQRMQASSSSFPSSTCSSTPKDSSSPATCSSFAQSQGSSSESCYSAKSETP